MTEFSKTAKISLMMQDDDNKLSDEDQALWDEFVSNIVDPAESQEEDFERLLEESEKGGLDERELKKASDSNSKSAKPQRIAAKNLDIDLNPQLDKRTFERLRKGKILIERRIDLHGFSQAQAHEALKKFILDCYKDGIRHVLVITGKGQGILKARTREWLSERDMKSFVLKYVTAQQKDGGDGALYVYLRRKRN